MPANRREFLMGAATVAAATSFPSLALAREGKEVAGKAADGGSPFLLEFDGPVLTSLKFAGDTIPTNYVATGQKLGHVEITWRRGSGSWQSFKSAEATATGAGTYVAKDDQGDAVGVTI